MDALSRAFAANGRRATGRVLYFESREDLAVERGPDAELTITHTSARGLCLDDPTVRPRLVYLSSDRPEDAARLILGTAAEGPNELATPRDELGSNREPVREIVERLGEITCRAVGTDTVRVRWVSSNQSIVIGRDDGLVAADLRQGWRIRLDAISATVELADGGAPPDPVDRRLDRLAEALALGVARRADRAPAPAGPATVVLGPGAAGIWVHEVFGHALEADAFSRNGSWLARPGAPNLPEDILICDDPRRCRTPISIDDEGTPTEVVTLIANGRVATCLHDRASAARAGVRSTGSARRASFRDPVLPRMSCTYLACGALSREQIVSSVSAGILVHRMEAGAVDPVLGGATFRVTDAQWIQGGEIREALEPHVLEIQAGLGFRGLLIGDDLALDTSPGSCHRDGQTLITSVGAPTVCLGMVGVVR